MTYSAAPVLDAAAVLVGWTNHSAERPSEKLFVSGETVRLSTLLDAVKCFSLVAAHPGHPTPVTVQLQVAPLRRDGRIGTWINASSLVLPARGGRLEALVNGRELVLAPADQGLVDLPCLAYARALITPVTPTGLVVGLTATSAA